MNILFPIAGLGTRFKKHGYSDPKPFIDFKGKPLIEWSISSLKLPGKYYIVTNGLDEKYIKILNEIKDRYFLDLEVLDIKMSTRGQAETCFTAIEKFKINLDDPLIITNCDQFTPWNYNKFLSFIRDKDPDALVTTYNHPKIEIGKESPYSHIEIDNEGKAVRLEEKLAISDLSLNGIFYWKHAELFQSSANKMISDNSDKSWSSGKSSKSKEKYVANSYNYLISEGKTVINYHMEDDEFVSLGSPEEIFIHVKRQNVSKAIDDLKKGKPIVMVDDYDREFEGDIVLAAEKATEENLLFAMRHARGLMCLPCTQEKLDQFKIPMMHSNGGDEFETPFATSIDAIDGATTGMSVSDRLQTIKIFVSDKSKPNSLAQPGHLFPLRARQGLLSERRGHTEGCVEILKLAGLKQIGVIIEIMDENGMMIKGDALKRFAEVYDLTFVSIEELYDEVYNEDSSGSIPLSAIDQHTLLNMMSKKK